MISVFYLSEPAPELIRGLIREQKSEPFSYPHAGATRERASAPGYAVDHNRVQLGFGIRTFEQACKALRQWKMFDIAWVRLYWPDAPIEFGTTVAVLATHLGFWSLNVCRIVYVLSEHGKREKYGFSYGTLPAHGERGEECFSVEFDTRDNSVWYDIFAFSKPRLMATLLYPYSRALQRRFAKASMDAMRRAVAP